MIASAAAASALPDAEATTPTVSTRSLSMANDGTWAATLTLTFNTPVAVHTSEADTISEIVIKRNRSNSNYFEANAVAAGLEFSSNKRTLKVFFDAQGKERIRNIAEAYASLYISGTALKSVDTSTALAQVGSLGYTSQSDSLSPWANRDLGNWNHDGNSTPPQVARATLDSDDGTLYIFTDEGIAYGFYKSSSASSSHQDKNYGTVFKNQTKYHVRDGSTATTGVTFSSSNTASVHGSPATNEIRVVLSSSQLSTVNGYTNPYLHIEARAFSGIDSSLRPVTTDNVAIAKQINLLPTFTAAQLTTATRALSVTFSESVTKSSGTFYIRDSATGAYNSGTDVTGTLAVSGTAGTATLTASDVTRVQGMSTPYLHLNAGAVTDVGSTDNLKKAKALTVIVPAPVLNSATLDRATGVTTLTFDKSVTKSTGNIDIREGSSATHSSSRDVRVAASHSNVSTSGSALTLTWASAALAKINAMASPHVYLASSVVTSGGAANAALTAGQDIVLSPRITSASLVPATRALSVTFSESVSAPSSAGNVYVASTGDADGFTSGTDVRLPLSGTAATHSATISAAELARVLAMTSPKLYAEANAATVSGLANAAHSAALAITAPVLSSAAANIGTGAVTLTFSYAVSAGTGNLDITQTNSATYDPSTHVRTAVSDTTVSGSQLSFTLSEPDRKKVIALGSTLWARLPSGLVSGGAGGDVSAVSYQFTVTADTTAPTLVTATPNGPALDEGTGILTLKFSESVKEGSNVDLTKIFIGGSTTASGGTALSATGDASELTSTVDTDSEITIKLREVARLAAIGHATPYVYFGAGAVKDLSDQTIAASTAAAEIADTADDDPPTVESASLDEGTGILTITFNETVDVSSASSNGASFELRNNASAPSGQAGKVVLSDGEIQSGQSDGLELVFELDEDSRRAAIALSNPYLYIAAGAITDTITPTPNAIAAKTAGTEIADTADDDGPEVEDAALNEGTGVLTVTFDEQVDVSSASSNGASFELREGASATDNLASEVVLSNGEIRQGQSDGLTFVFDLDEDSRQSAIALALPHLYVAAGAIDDTVAANGIALNTAGTAADITRDTVKPEIVSAALNEETGLLVITFDETVDVSSATAASFQIRDGSGSASGSAGEIVLSAPEIQASQADGAALNFQLSEASRRGAIDLADPYLYVSAGAVNDAVTVANSGIAPNGIDAASADIAETADTTAPSLSSAALDEGTGILTLTFDESVKDGQAVELGRIFIGDGAFSSGGEPLTGSTVTSSDATTDAAVAIELTEILRKSAIGYADPHVRLAEGAVRDVSDQDVAASSSSTIADTPDTTPPTISATDGPILHEPAGVLTVVFSESVKDGDDVDLTKIFVNDGPFTSGGTALTSSSGTSTMRSTEDTDPEILVTLHETLRLAVIAYTTPHLRFDSGAVRDLSGQAIVASTSSTAIGEVTDLTPPTVSSAALNEETGTLTLTFSEAIDVSTADGAKFGLREGAGASAGSSGALSLSNSEIRRDQTDGTAFVFELTEASRLAAINLGDPRLYVSEGAIEDRSLNRIAANAAGIDVSQTLDTTPPALLASGPGRPALDEATGVLRLTFGESVKEGADLSKVRIRDGPGTDGTALSGSEITSAHLNAVVTVDLTEALRQEAIGYSDPHVVLEAGAVRDLSDLPVAAAQAQISDNPDTAGPVLSSASLDEATGILVLTFDEPVKDGADLSKIFVADGSFATGGTALSGSQITSSGDLDAQVTIRLTETLRQAAAVYAAPHLRFEQGAVMDVSDQPVAASAASFEVDDTPDQSVLPAIMSAESVSPHTVRIYFNMPMTGAGSAEAWSVAGSGAISVRVPQERVITQDIPPPPRPDWPALLWPVPASWTTEYLDPTAVISAYITFRDPVASGQSLSYAPGDIEDFHDRAVAAQSVQISARSAYTPVDTAAVLASAITDGQASGSPVSPGEPYRTVKNYDPGYVFGIPSITHYHSLGGAADVDVYAVDGEELARTLYSGTWSTVRYDPATEMAHLSGRIGSPDTPAETVSLRGSAGTFAVVASAGDNGLQIVDITDPYSPRSASYMADGRSPMYGCADPNQYTGQQLHCITPTTDLSADPLRRLAELDGTDAVEIVRIGDRTFAVAASPGAPYQVGGFSMVDITDPGNPNSGYSVSNGAWAANIDALLTISDLAVFETGGKTYVAFASQYGGTNSQYQGAVTILDISDPAAIQQISFAVAGTRDSDGRLFDSLYNPVGIDTFVSGGSTYAVVSSLDDWYFGNDGEGSVQIIDLSDPASPKRAASITPGLLDRDGRAFGDIYSTGQVQIFELGGVPHAAIVASGGFADTSGEFIQIVNLRDPSAPRSAGVIGPYSDGHPLASLDSIKRIDVSGAGGRTVLAATVDQPDGLFLIDVTNPASPQRLAYARDGHNDPAGERVGLDDPLGVSLRTVDGRLYAAVASSDAAVTGINDTRGGLTILDLTETAGLGDLRTVTVGALVPLTGPVSPLGLHWEAAVKVAVIDLNAELEAQGADWRVSLDARDTEGRPSEALAQLIELDGAGVKAVIGPATSAGLAQVKQYAEQRGITLLSYGSTAASLAEDNREFGADIWETVPPGAHSLAEADGVFRTLPPDALAGSFAAEQLAKAGKTHVTVVFRDDPWERALAEQIRDEFATGSRTASLVPHESPVADPAALATAMAAAHKTGNSAVLTLEFSADAVTVMSAAMGASSAPGAPPAAQALGTSQWFGMVALDNTLSHALTERGVELLRLSASGTSTLETILDRDRIRAVAAQIASSSPSAEAAPFRAAYSAASGLPASGPISAEAIIEQSERIIDFVSQTEYTLIEEVPNREHPSFAQATRAISSMLDDRHGEFGMPTYAAYDAVRLLGRAMMQAPSFDAAQLREAIPDAAGGHRGLAGDGTLDANGDLAAARFELSQVRGGQAVKIPHYEVPLTVTEFTLTSRHPSGMARGGDSYEPTVAFVVRDGQRVPESVAGSCVGDADNRTIVDISFRAEETFTMGEFDVLINGRSAALQPPLPDTGLAEETTQPAKRFAAEWAACGTDTDGPLDISVEVMIDGVPVSFGEEKLTGPNVLVDNTAPQLEQISLVGQRSVALFYSEPVVTAASDYTLFEYGSSSVPAASFVHGSGTASVLARLDQNDAALMSGERIDFEVSGVTDRVGNALLNGGAKSLVPADARDGTLVLRDTARDGRTELVMPPDSIVRTVVAQQPVAIDASQLPDPASPGDRLSSAGGQTAEFSSSITVRLGSVTVVLPAGLQVGGLPADQTLPMSASSSEVPSDDYALSSRLDASQSTTLVEVGDPAGRVELSLPARIEFSTPLQELVFVVTGGQTLAVQECPEELTGSSTHAQAAGHLASLEGQDGTDAGSCYVRESSTVWTSHFSAWGTGPVLPSGGGSECDDCTPPTLGYDEYGAKLVDGGFAYNGLSSDVAYFFTPYPLIESEVGKQNTVALKMYENGGPGNVEHVSLAFGLRSGEVISESRAVINYDISFDGTGTVSVIDPDGAIDIETLSASHDVVECSAGSELECLYVTMTHTFRAPLEFDIVGTDVWDRERNSWQNYYNHGIRVSGEPLDPQPGVPVNGGDLVLYPVSSGTDVMMDAGGHLFKMSPQGEYVPLSNQSRLYHDIDESMYLYDGMPMQGYDRSDPQFRDHLYAQVLAAQKVLDSMMPPAEAGETAPEPAGPDREAAEQRLREAVLAEQARAALLFEELFGHQRINGQD